MLSKLWQKERNESPAQVSGQALLAKSLEMKNSNIVKFYKKKLQILWYYCYSANLTYYKFGVPCATSCGPEIEKYSFQIFVSDNAL